MRAYDFTSLRLQKLYYGCKDYGFTSLRLQKRYYGYKDIFFFKKLASENLKFSSTISTP